MVASDFIHILNRVEPVLFFIALLIFLRSGNRKKMPMLFAYIAFRFVSSSLLIGVIELRTFEHLTKDLAYTFYFFIYWISFMISAALVFAVIHEMFKLAMHPLPGLQRLGVVAFRWACGISGVIAIAASISPAMMGANFLMIVASQLERCESILTLCLLLFICLASQSLGLSYRSRVFGVSIGLAMMATADLTFSALFSLYPGLSTWLNVVYGFASITALAIWTVYFVLPEPERQAVALPVVSPLLRWNEIARALGHSGGRVLVGQPSPSMMRDIDRIAELSIAADAFKAVS